MKILYYRHSIFVLLYNLSYLELLLFYTFLHLIFSIILLLFFFFFPSIISH